MGAIIYWGFVRFALVLLGSWLLYNYVPNYSDWWSMFFLGVAVIVIYPAQLQYRKHLRVTRRAAQNELCATCRHFQPSEALCGALDVHVRKNFTPCEGEAWEPLGS